MKKVRILFVLFMLCCYLGLHGGYLALWDSTQAQPLQVFPFRAEAYPKADQEALRHGIPITSREGLSRLLEDFFS